MATRFTRSANSLYDSLLSLLYPQACVICGASVERRADGVACASCWQQVRLIGSQDNICWKCGVPSPGNPSRSSHREFRCRTCEHQLFTSARACGVYEGALRATILHLKREPWLCPRLLDQSCQLLARAPLYGATRIVAVPLHPQRQKERGFNQAAVIAKAIAGRTHLPFNEKCLIRVSDTVRHRAGMDARGRSETVANAFATPHPLLVKDERILLVDDVYTTGSTASACAGTLFNAGASDVLVLTLARPMR